MGKAVFGWRPTMASVVGGSQEQRSQTQQCQHGSTKQAPWYFVENYSVEIFPVRFHFSVVQRPSRQLANRVRGWSLVTRGGLRLRSQGLVYQGQRRHDHAEEKGLARGTSDLLL
jgi:hypothetical protein